MLWPKLEKRRCGLCYGTGCKSTRQRPLALAKRAVDSRDQIRTHSVNAQKKNETISYTKLTQRPHESVSSSFENAF